MSIHHMLYTLHHQMELFHVPDDYYQTSKSATYSFSMKHPNHERQTPNAYLLMLLPAPIMVADSSPLSQN